MAGMHKNQRLPEEDQDSPCLDEELAHRVQAGDRQALAELVDRHHNALIGYLYRLTAHRGAYGDRALAEDLCQETFLRAIRSITQYRYPKPFKPWLYAIATNLGRDYYKRAESRYTRSMEAGEEAVIAGSEAAEEKLEQEQVAKQVASAVLSLPEGQRLAIILRYYQDMSLAEISQTLDIPLGTVKSRLSLALRRLRQTL